MGQEQPSEFYDSRLERVTLPYEASPWRPVYDAVVEFLPSDSNVRILDVGCGTGRCAEAARRAGYLNYTGIDFSEVRVQEARRYVPSATFRLLDASDKETWEMFQIFDAFILTEFLEHVVGEREIIAAIPSGRLVIFSIPNFDSAGHVRKFPSTLAVEQRYGDLLDFETGATRIIPKPTRPDKLTFVFLAARRT